VLHSSDPPPPNTRDQLLCSHRFKPHTEPGDNLGHQLADSEGTLMVWDELGYSGYIDLVQENKP